MVDPGLRELVEKIEWKALEELRKCENEKDHDRAKSLDLLIGAVQNGSCIEIFKKAFEQKCACGGADNLINASDRRCIRCCLDLVWQVGMTHESFYADETALFAAVFSGVADIVALLIPFECGIKNAYSKFILTEFFFGDRTWLEKQRRLEVVMRYPEMTRELQPTDLIIAVLQRDLESCKRCIGQAARRDAWEQKTALMYAANFGFAEIVELLAEKEGGLQDRHGFTALMYAARSGAVQCIRRLVEKEAKMQGNDGFTALMFAAQDGRLDCARLLVSSEGRMH